MIENKHFLRFLNQVGLTVQDMSKIMCLTYETARARINTLDFTLKEIQLLSTALNMPIEDIISVIIQKKDPSEVKAPFALTKEIAWSKLMQDDDYVRIILECSYIGAGQRGRRASEREIAVMKKYIIKYTKKYQ